MAVTQDVRVQVQVSGPVSPDLTAIARAKVEAVLRHVSEPVLAVQVLLAIAPDPAVARPSAARAMVSVNGRIVRAEAVADTMRNAIDELVRRLRVRLERAWPSQRDCRSEDRRHQAPGTPSRAVTGHTSVIREVSVAPGPETPAAAARELGLLGYEFYLFTDELTGQDSVIYRTGDGYQIASVRPFGSSVVSAAKTAGLSGRITVSEHPAARLSVEEAITRLDYLGQSFVFFVDTGTGRGSVLYQRIDGRLGLVVPADAGRQLRM